MELIPSGTIKVANSAYYQRQRQILLNHSFIAKKITIEPIICEPGNYTIDIQFDDKWKANEIFTYRSKSIKPIFDSDKQTAVYKPIELQ